MKELSKRMERLEKQNAEGSVPEHWCEVFIHDPEHPQSAEEVERERAAHARADACNDDLVHIITQVIVRPPAEFERLRAETEEEMRRYRERQSDTTA